MQVLNHYIIHDETRRNEIGQVACTHQASKQASNHYEMHASMHACNCVELSPSNWQLFAPKLDRMHANGALMAPGAYPWLARGPSDLFLHKSAKLACRNWILCALVCVCLCIRRRRRRQANHIEWTRNHRITTATKSNFGATLIISHAALVLGPQSVVIYHRGRCCDHRLVVVVVCGQVVGDTQLPATLHRARQASYPRGWAATAATYARARPI